MKAKIIVDGHDEVTVEGSDDKYVMYQIMYYFKQYLDDDFTEMKVKVGREIIMTATRGRKAGDA